MVKMGNQLAKYSNFQTQQKLPRQKPRVAITIWHSAAESVLNLDATSGKKFRSGA